MNRLLLATDVWSPQVNGIVRTLETTVEHLRELGCETRVIEPRLFSEFRLPLYPDENVCLPRSSTIGRLIQEYRPHYIHLATEGPLGYTTRRLCTRLRLRFTTSYHTHFMEKLWYRWRIPRGITYRYFRWFHRRAVRVMVSTHGLRDTLRAQGFTNDFALWRLGVDANLFHPRPKRMSWERPVQMYVGRVSEEKRLESFLDLPTSGTKVIVGDGPCRHKLQKRYGAQGDRIRFLPSMQGEALAQMYAEADVFVFPSTTDTFGLSMLEALACGVPVATYPMYSEVLLGARKTGCMNDNLHVATETALREADPEACVRFVKAHCTWEECTRQFFANLEKIR